MPLIFFSDLTSLSLTCLFWSAWMKGPLLILVVKTAHRTYDKPLSTTDHSIIESSSTREHGSPLAFDFFVRARREWFGIKAMKSNMREIKFWDSVWKHNLNDTKLIFTPWKRKEGRQRMKLSGFLKIKVHGVKGFNSYGTVLWDAALRQWLVGLEDKYLYMGQSSLGPGNRLSSADRRTTSGHLLWCISTFYRGS